MNQEMRTTAPIGRRDAQRGVSMLFSLIAVIVLTLGGVALVRSVDTGVLVLGNLGFKQDSLAASSAATERAIAWIQANPTKLAAQQPDQGYYPIAHPTLDPTGRSVATAAATLTLVDWDGNDCAVPGRAGRPATCLAVADAVKGADGNSTQYVITRLCEVIPASDPVRMECVRPVILSKGKSTQHGSINYGASRYFGVASDGTYYRIVTRTLGVRGTISFTETLVHF